MQFQINAAGKRIYPSEFNRQVLEELQAGCTAAEVGRKHGVPIHNILYWRQAAERAVSGKTKETAPEARVPALLIKITDLSVQIEKDRKRYLFVRELAHDCATRHKN